MLTKRMILALAALAVTLPLVGCRHGSKCCSSPSASFAPPPAPCNDCDRPVVLPPGR